MIARVVLGLAYAIAGVFHLVHPQPFLQITPEWVPWPEAVIKVTGLCEILGAIALSLVPRLHRAAGWAFAVYAVCVFPANIKHAIDDLSTGASVLGWGYHGPRLLFQPVIVWWALWGTGITDWPFRRHAPDQ